MADHIATHASIGSSGRRCGTTYIHSPRQAWAAQSEPWFRFRNADCEKAARAAWAEPAPVTGEYFVVADESEDPNTGYSERVDGELLNCSLARYERDGITRGCGRHLQRIGGTEYFRWYRQRSDFCWYPEGRLLRLNDAGRALLSEPSDDR